jgi:glycosyltransferase involved in cell wall biosynthesis/SAM-dependent methyltransferase
MERFDDAWSGSLLGEVGSFLQLAPLSPSHEFNYGELLRAPWVRRASVWLDAIPAFTLDAFFTTATQFLDYQYILETLARFDCLLALSQTSADEFTALGFEGPNLVITGCRGSFDGGPRVGKPPGLPFDRFVVAVGNALPHKNLAAAAAGFVRSWVGADADLGLVVAANISDDQAAELETVATALGLEPHRVVIRRRLPDEEFCQLVSTAEAVVVPSFHEGFSMPIIEATGLGTPVVASDIPAHRELLGRGAWSFDPADPTTLSRALTAVLADPAGTLAKQQSRLRATHDADRQRRSIHRVVGELCTPLERTALREVAPALRRSSGSRRQMSLCKICELEDFRHSRLQHYVRDIFAHEVARFGEGFPVGNEYRKHWEIAMAVMAFDAAGLLDGSHRFLGVGAGTEATIFHLTRHAESVLATDLYLDESPWEHSANASMLTDPGAHWPLVWAPERLEVRHMDAMELKLEDESFGGVFSSSSIEHFGDRVDVERAIDEVFRVLEPGGIFSVSSEFRLGGSRRDIPGALIFDLDDVHELFVGRRDWELVEPFDPSVSEATMASAISLTDAAADQMGQVARLGGLWQHHITYRRYPHLVLRAGESTFTSFHLALRKSD